MHIRCPHCRNPIELVDDGSLSEATCPWCGSQFSLVGGDETQRFTPEKHESIAHFQLIERLGMGAFGTVWKAHDTTVNVIRASCVSEGGDIVHAARQTGIRLLRRPDR